MFSESALNSAGNRQTSEAALLSADYWWGFSPLSLTTHGSQSPIDPWLKMDRRGMDQLFHYFPYFAKVKNESWKIFEGLEKKRFYADMKSNFICTVVCSTITIGRIVRCKNFNQNNSLALCSLSLLTLTKNSPSFLNKFFCRNFLSQNEVLKKLPQH